MGHEDTFTAKDHALHKLIKLLHMREHAYWHVMMSTQNPKQLDRTVKPFLAYKIQKMQKETVTTSTITTNLNRNHKHKILTMNRQRQRQRLRMK